MPGIFVGAPSRVTLPEPAVRWTSLTHTWTCDGRIWDLTSDDSGVWLMQGVRGINSNPPFVHYRQKSAAVAGSRWRGFSTDEREVFWPLYIAQGDGSQAWLDYDAAFWSTMEPDKTGIWAVTQPGDDVNAGETRTLELRFESEGDPPDSPELFGWADYGVYLHAEQPYWCGPKIKQSWSNSGTQVDFYGGGPLPGHGFGPPFFISSAATVSRAAIANPGPVPGRPVWTVYGPTTGGTSLGVDGRAIDIPFTLGLGQWVRLDTDPTDQRALFGSGAVKIGSDWVIPPDALAAGQDRTRDLGASTRFGLVPARDTSSLEIVLTGTGTVSLELEPRYYRDH